MQTDGAPTCSRCRKREPAPGRRQCARCREQARAAYQRKRDEEPEWYEARKAKSRERCRAWYEQQRADADWRKRENERLLAHYHSQMLDPDYAEHRRNREREYMRGVRNDTERHSLYLERIRPYHREYQRRRLTDPEFRSKRNAEQRRRWRERYDHDPAFRAHCIALSTERQSRHRSEWCAQLLDRDGPVCGICAGELGDVHDGSEVHIDHIVPVSLGGPTVLDNLRLAHARCNIARGNRMTEDEAVQPALALS